MKPWAFFIGLVIVIVLYWSYTMAPAVFFLKWLGVPYPFYYFFAFFVPYIPPISLITFLDWLYWRKALEDYEE